MLRRVVLLGGALFACTPENQCQFQWVEVCQSGDTSCAGNLIDPTHWESGPIAGPWMDFSHNKNIHIHLRDAVSNAQLTGSELEVYGYVSPVATPNAPGQQYAPCAGNLCELHYEHDGTTPGWVLDVHNDSCADYFVYIAVNALEAPPAVDAGGQ